MPERRRTGNRALFATLVLLASGGCFYAADQGRKLEEKLLRFEHDRVDMGTVDKRLVQLEERDRQFREDIDSIRKSLDEALQALELVRQTQESGMMERSVLENRVQQLEDRLRAKQAQIAALEQKTGLTKSPAQKDASRIGVSLTPSAPPVPEGSDAFPVILDYIQAGDWVKARGGVDAVLNRNPSPRERAQALLLLGHIHYRQKAYSDAILVFDDITKRYPDFPEAAEALYYEAKSFAEKGNRDTANAFLKKLIKRYPDSPFRAKAQADLK